MKRAVEAAPDNFRFQTQLGTMYFKMKNYEEAVQIYENLVANFPERASYFQYLGFSLSQTDRKSEAPAILEKAIELGSNDAFTYAVLAKTFNEVGQHSKAIKVAQEGLKTGGQEAFLYYQWGEALSKLKQFDDAIAKFEKVLSYKDPQWTDAANKQIDRQDKLKKREEALREQGVLE